MCTGPLEENVGSDVWSFVKIGISIIDSPTIYINWITQKIATSSTMRNAIVINVDTYIDHKLNQ